MLVLEGMGKIVRIAVPTAVLVLSLVGGLLLWQRLAPPRPSTVRLMLKLDLKQLRIALDAYQASFASLPADLKSLQDAAIIVDTSQFDPFYFAGGFQGVLAFQRAPCRRVRKGEPWGGHGEVARYDIPSARLVLFADGTIIFMDEVDFQGRYAALLARASGK